MCCLLLISFSSALFVSVQFHDGLSAVVVAVLSCAVICIVVSCLFLW